MNMEAWRKRNEISEGESEWHLWRNGNGENEMS
jgi:hypothetical protein